MELLFAICINSNEWSYLITILEKLNNKYVQSIIANIQKKYLKDENSYIETKTKSLQYGSNYYELVKYFKNKNQINQAMEIAEKGINQAQGSNKELFDFLFNIYLDRHDEASLKRIAIIAVNRNSEAYYMLDKLYKYYKKRHNYLMAKEYIMNRYKYSGRNVYGEYIDMKKFLNKEDWLSFEPMILQNAKEHNIEDYLKICLLKSDYEVVLKKVKESYGGYDYFAEKLKSLYPEEVIEYYWQQALRCITPCNVKFYNEAAKCLSKVKKIYLDLNKENNWNDRFGKLKEQYIRRPALIAAIKKV